MKIYLLRHAIAVDHGTPGVTEEQRPLTPEGQLKMRAAAVGMKEFGVEFQALLTSPLVRARQTAEIVAAAFNTKRLLKELSALKPGSPIDKLWAALKPFSRCDRLMLVGHEPDLSRLASTLLSGRPEGLDINFKKGGLCLIEIDNLPPKTRGSLRWLLTPKQLGLMK